MLTPDALLTRSINNLQQEGSSFSLITVRIKLVLFTVLGLSLRHDRKPARMMWKPLCSGGFHWQVVAPASLVLDSMAAICLYCVAAAPSHAGGCAERRRIAAHSNLLCSASLMPCRRRRRSWRPFSLTSCSSICFSAWEQRGTVTFLLDNRALHAPRLTVGHDSQNALLCARSSERSLSICRYICVHTASGALLATAH